MYELRNLTETAEDAPSSEDMILESISRSLSSRDVECKIILKSMAEITPEDILKIEQLLNGELATQIWVNTAIGARFHITMEE